MLAAADWVIYAIPIIAFLVWLLSTAMRPAQPPAGARPNRPRGNEPVVHPERPAAQRVEDIPVVQPVQPPADRRDRLEEFLERRRRGRPAPTKAPRSHPRRPPPVVVVPEPQPTLPSPREVVVEPVVLPPTAVVQPLPTPVQAPSPERGLAVERRPVVSAEFQPLLSAQTLRRGPAASLVVLSRFLGRREDLQAAFLLRELLGPPKALHWLARGRPR